MHCLFLLTRLIFHVFELLFQYVLSILYVIAKYFSLRATTLQSFTINHNNNKKKKKSTCFAHRTRGSICYHNFHNNTVSVTENGKWMHKFVFYR